MMGEEKSAQEVVDIVLRDKIFYFNSGGGVTLSGGEPLYQPEFTKEILYLSKLHGIHTAIQTCGFASQTVIDKILPNLDLVIFDIKHLDDVQHNQVTGQSNKTILENLKHINAMGIKIVIQVPLIPGINDSDDNLESVFKLAQKLKNVEGVSLLSYHALGASKYLHIGKTYRLIDLQQPGSEYLKQKLDWATHFGVPLIQFNG